MLEPNGSRCVSLERLEAMTSWLMRSHQLFNIILSVLTLIASSYSMCLLGMRRTFFGCSRSLIFTILFFANTYSVNKALTEVLNIFKGFTDGSDPCGVQYRAETCKPFLWIHAFSYACINLNVTLLILKQTIATFVRRNFHMGQSLTNFASILTIVLSIIWTCFLFKDEQYQTYIATCTQFPLDTINGYLDKTSAVNTVSIIFSVLCFWNFFQSSILCFWSQTSAKRTAKTFKLEAKFEAYENVVTSKATCMISFTIIFVTIISRIGFFYLYDESTTLKGYWLYILDELNELMIIAMFLTPVIIILTVDLVVKSRERSMSKAMNAPQDLSIHRLRQEWDEKWARSRYLK